MGNTESKSKTTQEGDGNRLRGDVGAKSLRSGSIPSLQAAVAGASQDQGALGW